MAEVIGTTRDTNTFNSSRRVTVPAFLEAA
jgi:hypothetical protein